MIEQIMAQSRSSFAIALPLLPPDRRQAIQAIYAFCRTVDDVADQDDLVPSQKLAAFAAWRDELDRLQRHASPQTPIGHSLEKALSRFPIPVRELHAMLDGMVRDVELPMIAPIRANFLAYTRQVAGAVGVMVMAVLGKNKPDDVDFAVRLGDGLQTINILRDIDEDALRGRLYVPRDLLEAAGISVPLHPVADDIVAILHHPAFPSACQMLVTEADQLLADCQARLGGLDRRGMWPVLVMWGVYAGYLRLLKKRGWAMPRRALRVSKLRRLGFALVMVMA